MNDVWFHYEKQLLVENTSERLEAGNDFVSKTTKTIDQ